MKTGTERLGVRKFLRRKPTHHPKGGEGRRGTEL